MAALLLIGLSSAHAHGPERRGAREIVRLQGYLKTAPTGATEGYEVVLAARGVDHRFWVTDWRRFVLGEAAPSDEAAPRAPARLVLQADFEALARFAKSRPDQLLTLLGERRSASPDLFILTLDQCPP